MKINRYRPFFDVCEDVHLKNKLRRSYIANVAIRNTYVDIIMPTFNRSELLLTAIESICSQLHSRWRLYVCDDGSTDDTLEILRYFEIDPRVHCLNLSHGGVSHARNAGLRRVNGQYISFLDSDNIWSPEYLSLMLSFMHCFSLDCAYCAARLRSETSQKWLGDFFSWQACLEKNYIDLNCFMLKSTRRSLMFDESLYRFVDWDYILAATKDARVSYLPVPLVDYNDMKNANRITTQVYQNEDLSKYLDFIRMKHADWHSTDNNIDSRISL